MHELGVTRNMAIVDDAAKGRRAARVTLEVRVNRREPQRYSTKEFAHSDPTSSRWT